jgi:hypothetical protein
MISQARRKLMSQPVDQPLFGHENNTLVFSEEDESINDQLKDVIVPNKAEGNHSKSNYEATGGFTGRTFEERMEYYKEKHKKNIEMVEMEKLNAEKIECTFAPKIKTEKKQRSVSEFLLNQQQFQEERKRKLEFISTKLNKEQSKSIQQAPKINKKSLILAERKRSQSKERIHQRLFNDKKSTDKIEVSKCYPINVNRHTCEYIKKKQGKELEEIWVRVVGNRKYATLEQLCNSCFNI